LLVAASGFKWNLWLVAAGISGQGLFDFVHELFINLIIGANGETSELSLSSKVDLRLRIPEVRNGQHYLHSRIANHPPNASKLNDAEWPR
jgi:hypothetical protein